MIRIISGMYKNQRLATPKGQETRPTSERLREALFNICQNEIQDAHFLDLFAGSGAMGLEALSRGAAHATFIDSHKDSIRCIKKNIATLKLESSSRTIEGDVFKWIEKLAQVGTQYQIIYADPPYSTWRGSVSYSQEIVHLIDTASLLIPEGLLFIEEESGSQPIPINLKTLRLVSSRRSGRATLQQYIKKANS